MILEKRVTPLAAHPVFCRPDSSDIEVYREIFEECEYACVGDRADAGLIIDCGANAGYSAAYFLTRFPTSRVVAVEPDAENFEVLKLNLAPYGNRALCIEAAVWSRPAGLVIAEGGYRGGGHWTRQVRECRPGEQPIIRGVDLASIIDDSGEERVSILKMDIEGAEAVVLGVGCEAWIHRVDELAVELHDDSFFGRTRPLFTYACGGQFSFAEFGTVTLAKRLHGASAHPAPVLVRLHPDFTTAGVPFNLQPGGSAAIAVECNGASRWSCIVFDGTPLATTTFSGTDMLSALVPDRLYAIPGSREIKVVGESGESNPLVFSVLAG